MPHDSAHDDQHLVRYLLGLLPEDQTERLDEASIVDDGLAARLRSVEEDLVDSYVGGTIDDRILTRFESYYLASPRRREKVRFARQFLRLDQGSTHETIPVASLHASPRSVLDGRLQPPRFGPVWLLASVAVLVLACGVLVLNAVWLRDGLNDARHAVVRFK